jgi:hypothetical protein
MTLVPECDVAWFWAALVGPGRPLVALRDHEVPAPRWPSLEVRAPGLWAELVCEEPMDHWSVGLEAFAVAYDDPAEAWRSERGDPTALGSDLGWEAEGPARPVAWPGATGTAYRQPCRVHGEVLVGSERMAVDAFGSRSHGWGPRTWWEGTGPVGSAWAWGRLDSGDSFAGTCTDLRLGPDGLPARATVHPAGVPVGLVAEAHAPFLVPAGSTPSRPCRVALSMCRVEGVPGGDGRGWTEWLLTGSQEPPAPNP